MLETGVEPATKGFPTKTLGRDEIVFRLGAQVTILVLPSSTLAHITKLAGSKSV